MSPISLLGLNTFDTYIKALILPYLGGKLILLVSLLQNKHTDTKDFLRIRVLLELNET